ncbi:PTS sugar transporter subunit IIA [bacterium]|nr:PTS sugar transporter subunit IIA [bacterium]
MSIRFNKDLLKVGVNVGSKVEVLEKIAEISSEHFTELSISKDLVFSELLKREEMMSTGMSEGVAIPHCKLPGISKFIIGIIITSSEIEFEAFDGKGCSVFFFIIAPENKNHEHIKYLSSIALLIRQEGVAKKLSTVKSVDELMNMVSDSDTSTDYEGARNVQFQTVVYDHTALTDVLELVTAVSVNQTITLNCNIADNYLYSMPLYSSFWNNKGETFCMMIIANIPHQELKSLCNSLNDLVNKGILEFQAFPILISSIVAE